MKKSAWILIVAAVIAALVLVILFTQSAGNGNGGSQKTLECVPAPGCHPKTCIPADEAPPSDPGTICTAVCEPGTLDCGQGSCKAVNGKCEAVFN